MNDLISRQKGLDHLRKRLIQTANNNVGYVCDAGSTFEDASERVKTWLDEVPSIDTVPQWIPCDEVTGEGYPKEDGFYYVTERNYGFYLESDAKQNVAHTSPFFNGDFTDRFYDENHSNIVAWMPLPEPYKEEEEE